MTHSLYDILEEKDNTKDNTKVSFVFLISGNNARGRKEAAPYLYAIIHL